MMVKNRNQWSFKNIKECHTTAMIGEVWYKSWRALQSNDFWYVLVKICAKAVAITPQHAKTVPTKLTSKS